MAGGWGVRSDTENENGLRRVLGSRAVLVLLFHCGLD